MMQFYLKFSVVGLRNVLNTSQKCIQLSRSNYAFTAKLRERASVMYFKGCAFKRDWLKTVRLCQWRTKVYSVVVCRR